MPYTVLCCGSNGSSQLGVAHEDDLNVLQKAFFWYEDETVSSLPIRPKSIVCGGNHTLILFENGLVFAAGDNSVGQCGFAATETPQSVFKGLSGKWEYVAAGWEYSVLVNTKNEVYVCGKGLKGELGLKSASSAAQGPIKVDFLFPEITGIVVGLGHAIVRTKEGLYGWGSSRQGQLGEVEKQKNGKATPFITSPKRLDFAGVKNSTIKSIAVGRDCTTILHENTLETFGRNASKTDVLSEVSELHSMWSSIHYLKEGKAFSLGNNSHGQYMPQTAPISTGEISVGSEHGLIRRNGSVFAWGWGEHGNCGVHSETRDHRQSEVTFDYLNRIYGGPEEVVMVSGGCATSWVILRTEET